MNLFAFLQSGARYAPPKPRHSAAVVKAAEKARREWLDALLVDQTRAWLSLGERQPEVLSGLATVLTLAGMVHVFDTRSADTPELRVIRGAISAATQSSAAGSVLTAADAGAFSAAAQRAEAIIRAASVDALIHAATGLRETVGLPS